MSMLLRVTACTAEDNFCAQGVNIEREIVKELIIDEWWNKYAICLYDLTDRGTSFLVYCYRRKCSHT